QPLAMLIAFCLLWFDRGELAYLWLGLSCTVSFVFLVLLVSADYTAWIAGDSSAWLAFVVLPPVQDGLWILFWGYWFRLGRTVHMNWLYRLTWTCVLLLAVAGSLLYRPLYGRIVPVHAIVWLSPITDVLRGVLALVVVVLNARYLHLLHVRTTYFFFGISVSLAQIATVVSLGIITILMLRR